MATLKLTWQNKKGRRRRDGESQNQSHEVIPFKNNNNKKKKQKTKCTYKRGIGEDDLRLVGQDVELDDVPIAVPVDDFRVCGKEARKRAREKRP